MAHIMQEEKITSKLHTPKQKHETELPQLKRKRTVNLSFSRMTGLSQEKEDEKKKEYPSIKRKKMVPISRWRGSRKVTQIT